MITALGIIIFIQIYLLVRMYQYCKKMSIENEVLRDFVRKTDDMAIGSDRIISLIQSDYLLVLKTNPGNKLYIDLMKATYEINKI